MTPIPKIPKPKTPWHKTPAKEASRFKTARAKHRSRYSLEYRNRAKRIKRLRALLGQSQTEFAQQFGILSREINRWESGYHSPEVNNWNRFLELEKMARAVAKRAKRDGRVPNFRSLGGDVTTRQGQLNRYGKKEKRWGNFPLKG